jgi:hypothetical protein
MFIDDIFHSKWHPALKPVKELLDTEYRCITILNHRDPERMVKTIRRLSLVSSKPDIIVAYGTGATIAAQIKVVEKVLIKPYYNTSNVLKNMLGEKMKERIELPTLGKPEYLTITRQMLTEYRQIEEKYTVKAYRMRRPCFSVQTLRLLHIMIMLSISVLHTSCLPKTPSRLKHRTALSSLSEKHWRTVKVDKDHIF